MKKSLVKRTWVFRLIEHVGFKLNLRKRVGKSFRHITENGSKEKRKSLGIFDFFLERRPEGINVGDEYYLHIVVTSVKLNIKLVH